MGKSVLKVQGPKGSKGRTKDKLKNRVSRKSRLDFPDKGPKADSALGTGLNILSSRKSRVVFLVDEIKSDSTFCSDRPNVPFRIL